MRTLPLFTLSVLLFLIAAKVQSQTLQFSQVLLVSTVQTVPANKVWKVEGFMPSQSLITSVGIKNFSISVDNTTVYVAGSARDNSGSQYGWGFSANLVFQPLWLPAGTTLAADQNVFRVSVIEFTIVP